MQCLNNFQVYVVDAMLVVLGVNKSEHFKQERTDSLLSVRKTTTKFQRILENHSNIKR